MKPDREQERLRILRDERGTTSVEYAVIVGVLFLAIVASVRAFSSETIEMFSEIESAVVSN